MVASVFMPSLRLVSEIPVVHLLSRFKASSRSEQLSRKRTSYAVPIWIYRVARLGGEDGKDSHLDEMFWVRTVQAVEEEEC
jgi:hypothetical protein